MFYDSTEVNACSVLNSKLKLTRVVWYIKEASLMLFMTRPLLHQRR